MVILFHFRVILVREEPFDSTFLGDISAKVASVSKGSGQTWRQQEKNQEQNRWELNQMLGSGLFATKDSFYNIYEEDQERRVMIHVHDIRPPFLDENVFFTT